MNRKILIAAAVPVALLSLAGCKRVDSPDEQKVATAGPEGGPPPPPPYTIRDEAPRGDRHAAGRDGAALFSNHCGYCHLPGGMGTNLVTVQQVKAGNSPEMGLLTNREDLTAEYVKAVVRNGKVAMPPQTRVDITDAELDAVAAYLGKGK
ncbi:MAG: cytochrome c [Sphingomonadaceae bacterium]|jgi:mono/diheme cytochrome c family protein